MGRAWFMSSDPDADQRDEQHQSPPKFVSLDEVARKTGLEVIKTNPKTFVKDGSYAKLLRDRGYHYQDEAEISPDLTPEYERVLKNFYVEHIHTDDEIRYIEAGRGFFDVRDAEDRWIRVEAVAGDLVVVPAGIYHRFTLDRGDYIKGRKIFNGDGDDPVWTAHDRPCDHMRERRGYLRWRENGFRGKNLPI